jgi:hypothetical protein
VTALLRSKLKEQVFLAVRYHATVTRTSPQLASRPAGKSGRVRPLRTALRRDNLIVSANTHTVNGFAKKWDSGYCSVRLRCFLP